MQPEITRSINRVMMIHGQQIEQNDVSVLLVYMFWSVKIYDDLSTIGLLIIIICQ